MGRIQRKKAPAAKKKKKQKAAAKAPGQERVESGARTKKAGLPETGAAPRQYRGDAGADRLPGDQRGDAHLQPRHVGDRVERSRLAGQRDAQTARPRAPVGGVCLRGVHLADPTAGGRCCRRMEFARGRRRVDVPSTPEGGGVMSTQQPLRDDEVHVPVGEAVVAGHLTVPQGSAIF